MYKAQRQRATNQAGARSISLRKLQSQLDQAPPETEIINQTDKLLVIPKIVIRVVRPCGVLVKSITLLIIVMFGA